MSIRRKSTTHDLATLRLHPDGSRVQQSSANARHRTAGSTLIDARGNWIAKDAGGKTSVKTRRTVHAARPNDPEDKFIDLSGNEDEARRSSQHKGKQRARNSDDHVPDADSPQEPGSSGRLNTRTRRRLSFVHDLSFLDPPPVGVSSLTQDAFVRESTVSFPDPAPDLLKAIHHFASCYYRERGQLSDSSRHYRGMKNETRKQSQDNIHALAANSVQHLDVNSETEETEMEETFDEDEDESEVVDAEGSGKEEPDTKGDTYTKDMYKAFDGSALTAIGIVLQEYVAYTLSPRPRASEELRNRKRRRTR